MTRKITTSADANSLLLDQTPIGFNVNNVQDKPIVYISADPKWGGLTLALQNNASASITLDAASSVLKFYLAPLLTTDEIRNIQLASPGWKMTPAKDNGGQLYLELQFAAAVPVAVAVGQTVAIQFKNVLASGVTTPGRLLVDYSGIKPLKDGSQRIPVARQLPPTKNNDWPLTPKFGTRPEYGNAEDQGNAIYVTTWPVASPADAIHNNFKLEIVTSQMVPFNGETPSFIISFLSGDGEASLCSDTDIDALIADVDQPSGGLWSVNKDATTPLPVFIVTPNKQTTSFDVDSPIVIQFSNLVSMLPPDKSSPVYIQSTGLDIYNDGFFVSGIDKTIPTTYVWSFAAYSGDNKIAQGGSVDYGDVTLKWDVFAAQFCLVEETGKTGKATDAAVVPAHQPLTMYHLQPQVGSQEFGSSEVSFSVTPPKVGSPSLSPDAVGPYGASTLWWSCSNGAYVRVNASDGAMVIDHAPLAGSTAVTAGLFDTSFQVTCVGAGETSASIKLQVPPPAPQISAQIVAYHAGHGEFSRTTYSLVVEWNALYATSCTVQCLDNQEVISTALSGSWTPMDGTMPRNFRIVAVGSATVSKDASW